MAIAKYNTRVLQKHDMKENWDKATNFIPLPGEIIVYDDLRKIKIGDGVTLINDLPFFLENVVYSDETDVEVTTVPINADTLGGRNADEYATNEKVDALTYNDVGAAPAGFGLGGECVEVLDWNTATKNGFYSDTNGEERKHSPFLGMAAWGYTVAMKNDDAITQVAFTYATPNWNHALVQKIRHFKGAVGWIEWEWVNPPMEVGIEYRTTERWMGKHVYTRLIDFEALPNNSEKSATFYMDSKYTIVSIDGVVRGEGLDEYGMVKEFDIHDCPYVEDVAVLQLNNKITIKTNGDATKYNAKIVLKYTK